MRVIIFVLILISNTTLNAKEIIGLPRIVDGDTIHIGEYKIRLEGIDAPEMKQTCKLQYLKLSFLSFNKTYYCGVKSKEKLSKKINNKKINCKISSRDRYKRYIATCYKNKTNLNKWMVRNGHAVAYLRYSKKYYRDENYAKKKGLGLWRGAFLRPEKWRKVN
tara:strand:- start:165 stop:653 length:489 start_codon:yes stop_codon:yes gene_type:complete